MENNVKQEIDPETAQHVAAYQTYILDMITTLLLIYEQNKLSHFQTFRVGQITQGRYSTKVMLLNIVNHDCNCVGSAVATNAALFY